MHLLRIGRDEGHAEARQRREGDKAETEAEQNRGGRMEAATNKNPAELRAMNVMNASRNSLGSALIYSERAAKKCAW